MRNLAFIVAIVLFSASRTPAQSLALQISAGLAADNGYSPTVALDGQLHHHKRKKTPALVKIGTITSAPGVMTGIAGAMLYVSHFHAQKSNGVRYNSPADERAMHTGGILFFVGGVVGVTGAVLVISGRIRYHYSRKYSLHLVAPRSNELGLAYNF